MSTRADITFFAIAIAALLFWVGTTLWFVVITFANEIDNIGLTESYYVAFGIVSSTVVAQLAITTPGRSPSEHLTLKISSRYRNLFWINYTPAIYVTSWGVFVLLALVVGSLSDNSVLRTTGFSFLGNAMAATYVYFGIDPHEA
ncbi:hypothetical protein MHU86_9958 [Fragilaria crotonensis]|nr:hypothetical protein MHU86_9958 [Fragilaria crotonensis]